MKFSIVENDKSTYWDEVILALIIVGFVVLGIVICAIKPSVWIIDANTSFVFGVLMIVTGVMFIPGLIYRLCTNEKKK